MVSATKVNDIAPGLFSQPYPKSYYYFCNSIIDFPVNETVVMLRMSNARLFPFTSPQGATSEYVRRGWFVFVCVCMSLHHSPPSLSHSFLTLLPPSLTSFLSLSCIHPSLFHSLTLMPPSLLPSLTLMHPSLPLSLSHSHASIPPSFSHSPPSLPLFPPFPSIIYSPPSIPHSLSLSLLTLLPPSLSLLSLTLLPPSLAPSLPLILLPPSLSHFPPSLSLPPSLTHSLSSLPLTHSLSSLPPFPSIAHSPPSLSLPLTHSLSSLPPFPSIAHSPPSLSLPLTHSLSSLPLTLLPPSHSLTFLPPSHSLSPPSLTTEWLCTADAENEGKIVPIVVGAVIAFLMLSIFIIYVVVYTKRKISERRSRQAYVTLSSDSDQ